MKKLIFPLVTAGLLTAALAVPAFANGLSATTPPTEQEACDFVNGVGGAVILDGDDCVLDLPTTP